MSANPDQGRELMRENPSYVFFKELTGGAQSPVMSRPQTVPDFPLFVAAR